MEGTCEEAFLLREEDDGAQDLVCYPDMGAARSDARNVVAYRKQACEVWHLDFKTQKMTLVKVYKPRPKDDEEGIVEYV